VTTDVVFAAYMS